MTNELEHETTRNVASAALQATNPLASRALFWRARYMVASDFHVHLPFLFWLTEIQQPTSLIELGLHDGQSYFALCQAVDRLNLSARCRGVFLTKPDLDDAEVAVDVRNQVNDYNNENYPEFSKLTTGGATATLSRVADHSVDLLVLGPQMAAHTLEQVLAICQIKLSDRAVVILRGFPDRFADPQHHMIARQMLSKHDAIMLESGAGIAAVLVGPHADDRLKHFAQLKPGGKDYNNIHMVFGSLGKTRCDEWQSQSSQKETKRLLRELAAAKNLQTRTKKQLDELTAAYEERADMTASALSESSELKQTFAAQNISRDEAAAAQAAEIAKLTATLAPLQRDLAQAEARAQALQIEKETLAQAKDEEVSALTTSLENRDAALARLRAQIDRLTSENEARTLAARDEVSALTTSLENRDAALARLRAQIDRLTSENEARTLAAQDEVSALTEALEQRDAQDADAKARIKTLTFEKAALSQTHLNEVLALTRALEQKAAQTAQIQRELADAKRTLSEKMSQHAQIGSLTDALGDSHRQVDDYKARVAALEHALKDKTKALLREKKAFLVHTRLREAQFQRMAQDSRNPLKARAEHARIKQQAATVRDHPLFDAQWYLSTYPDIASAGVDPALHFVTTGVYEGRNPGPDFHTVDYYLENSDRLDAQITPLLGKALASS